MRIPAALCTALLLASCDSPQPAEPREPPLAGATIGGPFELIDETGRAVTQEDFAGRYTLVYFGYAYCPDICPYDVQRMMRGYEAFAEAEPDRAAKVQPLFITVDPERDTSEVVAEFTDSFSPDLIGLTGSREQIDAAAKAYGTYHNRGEDTPGGGYLVDHSRQAYLMGPDGEPIALLPVDESAEGVTQVLEQWVR